MSEGESLRNATIILGTFTYLDRMLRFRVSHLPTDFDISEHRPKKGGKQYGN